MQTQEKEKKVYEVFQSISNNYDQMNSVISFRLHKWWRRETMRKMQVFEGAKCLDLCCGTADWTIQLAEAAGPTGVVKGLDFSENMLAVGQKKVDSLGHKNIELVHGNAMELPFGDHSFDFVTIGFGLRNVPDYYQVIQEMYRVLKPGGTVVCLETSQPTVPLFREAYSFYFGKVMPQVGRLLAKSFEEYNWLQESTNVFLDRVALKELFERAGFMQVEIKSFAGGAAAMHLGKKW
ncbi:demethylmenaquinone methyltransferase [Exiguobacterium flavidum]|uniref:demethylmenaquinone methyltransferase n=1 Tax=Exiguobacterium flavidum TaxID=2184695 RepID=UPI000DF74D2B|nr:demethylmenaquinone methyltransferase [Exiguobacterium flavidum]